MIRRTNDAGNFRRFSSGEVELMETNHCSREIRNNFLMSRFSSGEVELMETDWWLRSGCILAQVASPVEKWN